MDLGLLLYRKDYNNQDTEQAGVMEIIIATNRNGSIGTNKAEFNPSIGKLKIFRK